MILAFLLKMLFSCYVRSCGDACGIWTRVFRLRAWCPDQLDESTIFLLWTDIPDSNRRGLFGRQKCYQLHQYPIWRCLRDSNPRCRRDSPASWPLDEGIIYGGTYRVRTGVICAAGRDANIYTNAPCGDACGIRTRVLRMKAWGPDQLNESTISIMFGDTCGNRTRITGETAQYLNRWTKVPNLMKTLLI